MSHIFKKAIYITGALVLAGVIWGTDYVMVQIPKNRIEYQKYETHLNTISQSIVEILQGNPEIHGISSGSLIYEDNHRCSLKGGADGCVQKIQGIQKTIIQIPSEIWFFRCHFSRGDIFIRQRRNYSSPGRHKYEFFVPFVQEDLKSLRWIEYKQNRDSWYEIECDPWEDE